MSTGKPRVVKDYGKLSEEVLAQIKLKYPHGFHENLVTFKNKDGDTVSALPFEADDAYYLVRMTKVQAMAFIEDDDDYDDDGNLMDDAKESLEEFIDDED